MDEVEYQFITIMAPPSVAGLGWIDVCLTCGCEVPKDYQQMHVDWHKRLVDKLNSKMKGSSDD